VKIVAYATLLRRARLCSRHAYVNVGAPE